MCRQLRESVCFGFLEVSFSILVVLSRLMASWCHFGAMLEPSWGHLEAILGLCSGHLRGDVGVILGPYMVILLSIGFRCPSVCFRLAFGLLSVCF